jgi:hypothetical protein
MIDFRAKIHGHLLQLIILVASPVVASAQPESEMKKIFAEAESRSLFEEYELAIPLYLMLDNPENYNIRYKIGVCYLNLPGEKDKAIPYLETQNILPTMRRSIPSGKSGRRLIHTSFWQNPI